jgi:prepilin peptidase CpaA
MWELFIVGFAVTVAVGDLCYRTIPATVSTAGLLAGLFYHAFLGGFMSAALTAVLGFVLGIGLYELRAIGGGDVKLICALGAMLGFKQWVPALELSLVLSGVMAFAMVVYHGAVRQTFGNVRILLQHLATNGLRPHPQIELHNPDLIRVPFGVAAAIGLLFTTVLP